MNNRSLGFILGLLLVISLVQAEPEFGSDFRVVPPVPAAAAVPVKPEEQSEKQKPILPDIMRRQAQMCWELQPEIQHWNNRTTRHQKKAAFASYRQALRAFLLSRMSDDSNMPLVDNLSDASGVDRVDFYLSTSPTPFSTSYGPPFTVDLQTLNLPNGPDYVWARALRIKLSSLSLENAFEFHPPSSTKKLLLLGRNTQLKAKGFQ